MYGGCRKGTSCGCSCAFSSPHLTSFVVADPGIEVAGEVTVDALVAGVEALVGDATAVPSPTPAPAAGADTAFPLVPAVAAAAFVALIAGFVIVRRQRSRQSGSHMSADASMELGNIYPGVGSGTLSGREGGTGAGGAQSSAISQTGVL